MKRDGNGRLRRLAAETQACFARMDDRLGKVERNVGGLQRDVGNLQRDVGNLQRDVGNLQRDVGHLRKNLRGIGRRVKVFTDFVVDLDARFLASQEEFRRHRADWTVHTLQVR